MIIIATLFLIAAFAIYIAIRPSFGYHPSGERLERVLKSPNYKDGRFKNMTPTPTLVTRKSPTRILSRFLFSRGKNLRPGTPVPAIKTDLHNLPKQQDCIIWFGHSSYMIQTGGQRFLIDPVFHAAAPLAMLNRPFKGTDIYRPEDIPQIDCLVITHDHWDHLDYKTVKALNKKTNKVICPLGAGEHFEHWGYDKNKLVELDWQETFDAGDGIIIHCLPARHFSGRGLIQDKTLWASYLIIAHERKFYIGGDGGYGLHHAETGKKFGPIDWAMLENGQYNEAWKYIHTMPYQLQQTVTDLNAKHVITVHHSKYALSLHPWDEPLKTAAALKAAGVTDVVIPRTGEVVLIGR